MGKITPLHIISLAIGFFAVWTLCVNGVYALGGSLFIATVLCCVVLVGCGVMYWRYKLPHETNKTRSPISTSLDWPPLTRAFMYVIWALLGAALVVVLWPWGKLDYRFPVALPVTTVLQLEELHIRENSGWFHVDVKLSQTREFIYEDDDPEIEIKLEFEPLDERNVFLANAYRDQKVYRYRLLPPERVGEWTESFTDGRAFTFAYQEDMRAIVRLISKEPVIGRDTGPELQLDFAELEKGQDGIYAGNMVTPARKEVGRLILAMLAWSSLTGALLIYRRELRIRWDRISPWAGSFTVAVLCAGYAVTLNYMFLWLGGLACLLWAGSAMLPEIKDSNTASEDEGLTWYEWVVVLLAVGAAVWVSLYAHRPTWDDTYYFNRAAVLAQGFFSPMPHHYTLFPDPATPFPYPTFPFIAWHDLNALFAVLTGLEPLQVNAYILAPLSSALMVLSYAVVFRLVLPKHWPWALLFWLTVMLVDGSQNSLFSNQGFARAWVGKSVLLHVLLPYTAAMGFRYGQLRRRGDWIRLALAQVAVVGVSSTGIWMGPAVAGISLLAGGILGGTPIRILLRGGMASGYPIAIGLWGIGQSYSALAYRENTPPNFELLDVGYFGSAVNAALWYGAVLAIPFLGSTPRIRWLGLVAVGTVWLTFANPWLAGWFSENITSGAVFVRYKHLMLLPILGAAMGCIGFRGKTGTWLGPVICIVLAGLYVRFVPTTYLISDDNSVAWHEPTEKIHAPVLKALGFIMPMLPEGVVVIAPDTLAPYLPCYRRAVYVVAPRENVILHTTLHAMGNKEEYTLRRWTLHFASGFVEFDDGLLAKALDDFKVDGVILVDNEFTRSSASFLQKLGFKKHPFEGYIVWLRQGSDPV